MFLKISIKNVFFNRKDAFMVLFQYGSPNSYGPNNEINNGIDTQIDAHEVDEDSSEHYNMLVNFDQLIYLMKLFKMFCFLLN